MVEATSMVSRAIRGDNLKSSSPRAFARLIERGGSTLFRVNGSHHIYRTERRHCKVLGFRFCRHPAQDRLAWTSGELVRLAELSDEELELKAA
jgi:predicted RNA binding protein YcfA (HicA-like mRNA interferase family)